MLATVNQRKEVMPSTAKIASLVTVVALGTFAAAAFASGPSSADPSAVLTRDDQPAASTTLVRQVVVHPHARHAEPGDDRGRRHARRHRAHHQSGANHRVVHQADHVRGADDGPNHDVNDDRGGASGSGGGDD